MRPLQIATLKGFNKLAQHIFATKPPTNEEEAEASARRIVRATEQRRRCVAFTRRAAKEVPALEGGSLVTFGANEAGLRLHEWKRRWSAIIAALGDGMRLAQPAAAPSQ